MYFCRTSVYPCERKSSGPHCRETVETKKNVKQQTEVSSDRDATLDALARVARSAAELAALRIETLRKSPKGGEVSQVKAWMGVSEQAADVAQSVQEMRGGAAGRNASDLAADIRAQCLAADSLPQGA